MHKVVTFAEFWEDWVKEISYAVPGDNEDLLIIMELTAKVAYTEGYLAGKAEVITHVTEKLDAARRKNG